jgi:tRNA(Arg) A34 adenosine deaminase TadA
MGVHEMTNKQLSSLCRLYEYIYSDKPFRNTKTVSFLMYKGKIISFGVNSDKTSPMQKFYRVKTELKDIENFIDKEHSEINCLRKCDCSDINFAKTELVIISKRCDGLFRLARPCPVCMKAIKDFGITRIYYTNRDQTFSREDI